MSTLELIDVDQDTRPMFARMRASASQDRPFVGAWEGLGNVGEDLQQSGLLQRGSPTAELHALARVAYNRTV
jgi:hypothetical protein